MPQTGRVMHIATIYFILQTIVMISVPVYNHYGIEN